MDKEKKFGFTLAETQPETYALADKYIPGIYGSFREAWIKGYLNIKVNMVKKSAYERFYKLGKRNNN